MLSGEQTKGNNFETDRDKVKMGMKNITIRRSRKIKQQQNGGTTESAKPTGLMTHECININRLNQEEFDELEVKAYEFKIDLIYADDRINDNISLCLEHLARLYCRPNMTNEDMKVYLKSIICLKECSEVIYFAKAKCRIHIKRSCTKKVNNLRVTLGSYLDNDSSEIKKDREEKWLRCLSFIKEGRVSSLYAFYDREANCGGKNGNRY